MIINGAVLVLAFLLVTNAADGSTWFAERKIKVLIVDGQNNHPVWPKTTMMMRQYLQQTGKFTVDIARTRFTWNGGELLTQFPLDPQAEFKDLQAPQADPEFKPIFSDYDVVVSNFGFNAAPWPEMTRRDFERWMKQGGGLVVVHAANNSFGDWPEYNRMIGLGGWGGRGSASGPRLYFDAAGKQVRDNSTGKAGSHGPQHEFPIVIREPNHPVTHGMPMAWLHAQDELYDNLRGPAENVSILATAFSSEKYRGTGRHEPMIMAISYEKGRVFHTPMGHAEPAMQCVGFITTFVRGAEWAATGKVTIGVPADFPDAKKSSSRKFDWDRIPQTGR